MDDQVSTAKKSDANKSGELVGWTRRDERRNEMKNNVIRGDALFYWLVPWQVAPTHKYLGETFDRCDAFVFRMCVVREGTRIDLFTGALL